MNEEMDQIVNNQTYHLVSLPVNCKAIPCRWVYKIKRDMNGEISRYKLD